MKTHIERLISQLEDPNQKKMLEAAKALQGLDSRATQPLLDALRHEKWTVRTHAAHALGEIGDPQAVDGLLSLLNDPADPTIAAAVKALGKIGDARALGEIGGKNVNPALLDALEDEDWMVRWGVVEALGKIGEQDSIPALTRALADPYERVRRDAAALKQIGTEGI